MKKERIQKWKERIQKWRDKQIKEHGWYMHYIEDNYHTHHVLESFGHPDFQTVMNMTEETISGILSNFVDRVKDGEKFSAGQIVEGIADNGYKIKLVGAIEDGRPVLRLIIPEANGNLDEDKMTPDYRRQYEGTFDPIEFLAFIPGDEQSTEL
jgi:hypothetical protein